MLLAAGDTGNVVRGVNAPVVEGDDLKQVRH
jgi:hypothetical protein